MCQILNISRSSFYEWLKRPERKRKKNDKELIELINKIHKESYETYGQKRIKISC